jgi:hypothetical protein
MSAYGNPRVVLVGKQKNHQDYVDLCNLISDIRPSQIPREFIHTVLVTTQNNRLHELSNKQLSNGVDYENIEQYLSELGIKIPDVQLVEIVQVQRAKKRTFVLLCGQSQVFTEFLL